MKYTYTLINADQLCIPAGRMMNRTLEKDPVSEMLEAIMKVARGERSAQVEFSGENDEFDSLAAALNMMIDDIRTGTQDLDRRGKELSALNKHLHRE